MSKITKMTPFISRKIWGGNFLSQIKNIETDSDPVGETWEVSTLEGQSSLIGDKPLNEICRLSYLVKFIDTSANLSVQVHPGDEYAKEFENSSGKSECWFILDAKKDAGIYLGLKPGVTKKEFFNAVDSGLRVDGYLNFIPVKKGDFFFVPAGAIHAIGADVVLCEVQQSSGITYRVWDWNRLDNEGNPRELHIEKARDTIDFDLNFNQKLLTTAQKDLLNGSKIKTLVKHKDFKVDLYVFQNKADVELSLNEKDTIVVLDGELEHDLELFSSYDSALVMSSAVFKFKIKSNEVSFLLVS